MTDDVKDERETEEEEAAKGLGHNPKGQVLVDYPDSITRMTGRGSPFYGGPTKPPLGHPPTYDLIPKKRLKIYRSLVLATFLVMFFGSIAGLATGIGGSFAGPSPFLLLFALVGFLGAVFYGISLVWNAALSRRRNPSRM